MSAAEVPVPISVMKVLAIVIAVVVLLGAGPGLLTESVFGGPGQPTPPGASDAATDTASIAIDAGDPPNVRDERGTAGLVAGDLTGSLTLESGVDRVELVLETRLPSGEWVVQDRATVRSVEPGTLDLGALIGGHKTTYLRASQSSGFDVDTPGSTAHREGHVSVTARLYVDGEEVDAVSDSDGYAFYVDRPAMESKSQTEPEDEPAVAAQGVSSGSNDGAGSEQSVAVAGGNEAPASGEQEPGETENTAPDRQTVFLGADHVMPGSSGSDTVTVTNPADEGVTATFAVGAPIDEENGITEPESEVDDTPDQGELSEHLDVRIMIVRADGSQQYLAGGNGYVSLESAAGETTSLALGPEESVSVHIEWRIDRDVGNEIQSDGTTISVHRTIESDQSLTALSLR